MHYLVWIIIILVILFLLRRYLNSPKNPASRDLRDKVVIITGCSAGLGKEATFDLLKKGATVIMACRDREKTYNVINSIENIEERGRAVFMKLDLCSLSSVYSFSQEFRKNYNRIDILMNNAGLMCESMSLTEDGLEKTMQTNHYGHMALTFLLLDLLDREEGRVINVASMAYLWDNFTLDNLKKWQETLEQEIPNFSMKISGEIYANSKLANIYFTQYLSDILKSKGGAKTFSLHPGLVITEFQSKLVDHLPFVIKQIASLFLYSVFWFVSKDSVMGAQTQLYLSCEKLHKLVSGGYYKDCSHEELKANAANPEMREEFIKLSWLVLDKATKGKFNIPRNF